MTITLNHTVVPAAGHREAARFFADAFRDLYEVTSPG
jgi:hypothetical protein